MPTSEEVTALLQPSCTVGCVKDLSTLCSMDESRPGIIVPDRFFFSSQDRRWLTSKKLIEAKEWGHTITSTGKETVEALRQHLANNSI